jgi:RHS repeat-associated protein
MTDANLNRTAVAFDALGMVVKTAVMGKEGANEGDTLEHPTTELQYDLLRWQREQKPAVVHTIAREEHFFDNASSRLQHAFAYSDGFGRIVQQKVQAEPETGTNTPRWVGTGRTVFNNKGNPVKLYEPFFSATSDFEDEDAIVQTGVTPIIHYDPLDRVIRTELPDGSESRVEFDAWLQKSFDPNDAIAGTRWLSEHQAGTADQQRAAALALTHANTPTTAHLDALGRSFLVQADNGIDPNDPGLHDTRTAFDIEGNVLAIRDARGITAMRQVFDALQRRLRTQSPDAGIRLAIADCAGKLLRAWDSRGQTLRSRYDELQRPTHQYVKQAAIERLLLRTVFGEALDAAGGPTPSPAQQLNLRGKPYQVYDCAGLTTTARCDFKGNILEASRRLAVDFRAEPDWLAAEDEITPSAVLNAVATKLEDEIFTTRATYDALNRVRTHTTPDGSVARPLYNEANLLEQLRVSVRGGPERIVINDLDYNARGQRILCEYADPTSSSATVITTTSYAYDPKTFRLTELRTLRGGTKLQHLVYTYDPVGNITSLRNGADNGPFFSGAPPVSGDGQYSYDALYRIIEATGREHPGTQPVAFEPAPGALPHANDTSALIAYTERYRYDPLGNIEQMKHLAGPSGNAGWTRNYEYAADSNRLQHTSVPGSELSLTETYLYDEHGSMTKMPHLAALDWDYADRLQHTQKSNGDVQDTYFTYDAAGQRVRKVFVTAGAIKERIYLGGYEVYRERANLPGSIAMLERQTLHVMDDQRRVALVETKTRDGGSDIATPAPLWRFQLDNHLGSSMVELDHQASVISYEEYHPYGSTAFQIATGSAEVSAKRYRYTSKERDEETGLYYHGARYYAPWLARWTAVDPAGLVDGPNPYQYVRSNPLGYIDARGTEATDLANPQIVKEEKFTGKESQAEIRGKYAELGIQYEGNATWNAASHSWFVDRKQLKQQVEELTFEPEQITAKAPAGPGQSGGGEQPGPGNSEADPNRPASAGEAAGAFAKGALKGAAFAVGLVALGSLGTAVGVGLLAYGAYTLATGGYKDVAASVSRLASGKGSASDFEAAGGVVGGILGGGAAGIARGAAAGEGGGAAAGGRLAAGGGEVAASTEAGAATAGRAASGVAAEGAPRAYSVAFETTLGEGSRVGSRGSHFAEANQALYRAMQESPELAASLRQLGVDVAPGARGAFPRTPPAGWTWHHELEPGVMRLVPREQHTIGSPWWNVLHPGGQGGYSIWGR